MRSLSYLWLWSVCWDETRQWTFLFSLMIPLAGFWFTIELARLLMDKKVSTYNLIILILIITFVNETLLKPISTTAPYSLSCTEEPVTPSTAIAVSIGATVLYALRYIFSVKEFVYLLGWFVTFVLEMIAYPVLKYLSVGYAFVSIVPGLVLAIIFWILCEFRSQTNTSLSLYQVFHLTNDIQPGNERAQDLLPE